MVGNLQVIALSKKFADRKSLVGVCLWPIFDYVDT